MSMLGLVLAYLALAALACVIVLLPVAILALVAAAVCRLLGISFDCRRFGGRRCSRR